MEVLAVTALIALVVFGVMVLRLKSDPTESRAIKKCLADSDRTKTVASPVSSRAADSKPPRSPET